MNKKIVFAATFILLLALVGCGKGEEAQETAAPLPKTVNVEELNDSGKLLPITQIQWYDKESYQPYWCFNSPHRMTKGEDGYYFAGFAKSGSESLFLGHVSEDGSECIPVCSDASCNHQSYDCTACFSGYEPTVWYYKDYIYTMKRDKGNVILVGLALTGQSGKNCLKLALYLLKIGQFMPLHSMMIVSILIFGLQL